jgi:drug/metabolite transporter (DMT)-like permease
VSIATRLQKFNSTELASIAFYAIAGILLLVSLPLTSFPPHVGTIGILSLITAYSMFTKRAWAPWLIVILFVTASVFAIFTLYLVGFSNAPVTISMIAYVALTWLFTIYFLLKRRT